MDFDGERIISVATPHGVSNKGIERELRAGATSHHGSDDASASTAALYIEHGRGRRGPHGDRMPLQDYVRKPLTTDKLQHLESVRYLFFGKFNQAGVTGTNVSVLVNAGVLFSSFVIEGIMEIVFLSDCLKSTLRVFICIQLAYYIANCLTITTKPNASIGNK